MDQNAVMTYGPRLPTKQRKVIRPVKVASSLESFKSGHRQEFSQLHSRAYDVKPVKRFNERAMNRSVGTIVKKFDHMMSVCEQAHCAATDQKWKELEKRR